MTRVLDPGSLQSFLPQEDVWERAQETAISVNFLEAVSDEHIDLVTDASMNDKWPFNRSELRNQVALQIVSMECMQALMSDGCARSEFQIAGEVCRIKKSIDAFAHLEAIEAITKLTGVDSFRPGPQYLWQPEGTIMPCPTIDGGETGEIRMISLKTNGLVYGPNFHDLWLQRFLEESLPVTAETNYLRLLELPFLLDTGDIIAESSPRYYRRHQQPSLQEILPPRELISA